MLIGILLAGVAALLAWQSRGLLIGGGIVPERVDMVLVMAGGNDVVQLRGLDALQGDVERVRRRARQRADLVVLMPAGNVGNAPFCFAPISWLMTWRSRRLQAFVSEAASRHGAVVVKPF